MMKKKIEKTEQNYYVFYKAEHARDGKNQFRQFENEKKVLDFLKYGLTRSDIEIDFVVLGQRLYPTVEVGPLTSVVPDNTDELFYPPDPSDNTVDGLVKRLDSLKSEEMKVRNELNRRG